MKKSVDFTLEGYNDKPKKCPRCKKGKVYSTRNANVGRCDNCNENVPWRNL